MAYEEYFDLYLLAQEKSDAPYYIVSFDVINSKKTTKEENIRMHKNIDVIVKYVYNKLLEAEKILNKPVVVRDERFFKPWRREISKWSWNGNYMDPFLFGDCFQFTVLRNTITKEQIVELVNECKDRLNMKEGFHIADGYYETNNWDEAGTKFYRGYCIQTLETLHKPRIQKELKKVKKLIMDNNK